MSSGIGRNGPLSVLGGDHVGGDHLVAAHRQQFLPGRGIDLAGRRQAVRRLEGRQRLAGVRAAAAVDDPGRERRPVEEDLDVAHRLRVGTRQWPAAAAGALDVRHRLDLGRGLGRTEPAGPAERSARPPSKPSSGAGDSRCVESWVLRVRGALRAPPGGRCNGRAMRGRDHGLAWTDTDEHRQQAAAFPSVSVHARPCQSVVPSAMRVRARPGGAITTRRYGSSPLLAEVRP